MELIKNKILELVKTKPKHYSKIIKNTDELNQWVLDNSLVQSSKYAEMIYSAVHQVNNVCQNNKVKKFSNFEKGYIGCGPTGSCACAKQTVAASVKQTKKSITIEQQKKINEKRQKTNLEKYGVSNIAQTRENKQKFRDWYADPGKTEWEIMQDLGYDKIWDCGHQKYILTFPLT